MHSVDVTLTQAGTWRLRDNVLDNFVGGTSAIYRVMPSNSTPGASERAAAASGGWQTAGAAAAGGGAVRMFYIRAENASWNFAPQGYSQCTNTNYPRSAMYLNRTNVTIGAGM